MKKFISIVALISLFSVNACTTTTTTNANGTTTSIVTLNVQDVQLIAQGAYTSTSLELDNLLAAKKISLAQYNKYEGDAKVAYNAITAITSSVNSSATLQQNAVNIAFAALNLYNSEVVLAAGGIPQTLPTPTVP